MSDDYEPTSNFLIWVLNGETPLTGSEQAANNLTRVITLTKDDDAANRDWATFILGNHDIDSPAVRAALVARADDPDERVRAEAIRGLAREDRLLALPFIQRALEARSALVDVFEAAAIVADASLVGTLRQFAKKAKADWTGDIVRAALHACETGVPDERYV
jgi:hypothetical protein